MPKPLADIVLIALSSPILVGVYSEEGELIETHESQAMSSEYIPELFVSLMERFSLRNIVFAKGPGSYMSIKVVYLFLQTLRIARGISLKACEGFSFNGSSPIKAIGKLYFFKENGAIITRTLGEGESLQPFALPERFAWASYDEETSPLYVLPAV